MNTIEEKLWNYIDGNCSTSEKSEIEKLLSDDESVQIKYRQLLSFNDVLMSVEPYEPSMRFTQNVIERINKDYPIALKTHVDKRIVNSIGLMLVSGVIGLLIYVLVQAGWSSSSDNTFKIPYEINFSPNKNFINMFLFADAVIGLFLIDKFLSKKRLQDEMNKVAHK